MYEILTWVNIVGCICAILYIIKYVRLYVTPPRWKMFIYWKLSGIVFMLFSQVVTLMLGASWWLLKVGSFYMWANGIFYIWNMRFISIRKKEKTGNKF